MGKSRSGSTRGKFRHTSHRALKIVTLESLVILVKKTFSTCNQITIGPEMKSQIKILFIERYFTVKKLGLITRSEVLSGFYENKL